MSTSSQIKKITLLKVEVTAERHEEHVLRVVCLHNELLLVTAHLLPAADVGPLSARCFLPAAADELQPKV